MSYRKDQANPVFIVQLVDQYGDPVTGVTAPTVTLSKAQGANTTVATWVKDTDFTWHELTSGETFKGVYKLRQKDAPNISAVDTAGACALHVIDTDVDTAAATLLYGVEDVGAAGPLPAAIADAVWDELKAGHATAGSFAAAVLRLLEVLTTDRVIDRDTGVQSFYNEAGTVVRYTSTPSTPTAVTSKDTIAEA